METWACDHCLVARGSNLPNQLSPCLSSDERGAVPRSELRSVATQPIVTAAVADTTKLARRCAPVEWNVNVSTAGRYFMKWYMSLSPIKPTTMR